jgi:2-iminobutanoate/2-iminopropanoate deaminase
MTTIHTDHAPQPIGPYSQAVIANGFLFISGQVGIDAKTNTLAADFETQTKQTLKNLQSICAEAGTDLAHVVKTTIFLINISDFVKVNEIYGSYFTTHKPARSTIQISKLPQGTFENPPLIEIEAVVSLSK